MFDAQQLKEIKYTTPQIEGGGNGSDMQPRILTDENNIQTMNQDDLFFYVNNYVNSVYEKDLLGRSDKPFYSKGKNRIDEFMGILAVESLSNRNTDGEYTDFKPKPYNVNSSLQDENNDSYSIFQIDTGPALTYIIMAMDTPFANDLNSVANSEEMHIVNKYAAQLFEQDDVKNEIYTFLKDPKNIEKHLQIAATIWNDHERSSKLGNDGANGWNAYKNYTNKTKGQEFIDTYELYMNKSKQYGYDYLQKELINRTQRHREEFDDLKQFLNMPKLGATIEEAANNLAEIYENAIREGQIPEEAGPVDNLKELGKMFKR
jgi:hypothetical protein